MWSVRGFACDTIRRAQTAKRCRCRTRSLSSSYFFFSRRSFFFFYFSVGSFFGARLLSWSIVVVAHFCFFLRICQLRETFFRWAVRAAALACCCCRCRFRLLRGCLFILRVLRNRARAVGSGFSIQKKTPSDREREWVSKWVSEWSTDDRVWCVNLVCEMLWRRWRR